MDDYLMNNSTSDAMSESSLLSDGLENNTMWNSVTSGDITTEGPILDEEGNFICAGPSEDEYMFYVTFAWWLEGFGILLVGSLGRWI